MAIAGFNCVVFGRRKSYGVEKMCSQGFMELDPCGYRVQSAHVVELWRDFFFSNSVVRGGLVSCART